MISKVVLLPENPGRLTDRFWIIDGYEILKIPWQLTDKTALVFSGPYFPEFGLNTEIYGVNRGGYFKLHQEIWEQRM